MITLDHQTVNGNDYTRPQALFYSSLSSPTLSGRGATDVCARFQYPPVSTAESIDEIPAGERVRLRRGDHPGRAAAGMDHVHWRAACPGRAMAVRDADRGDVVLYFVSTYTVTKTSFL